MIIASTWLTKLILSHMVTDFVLQPKSWIDDRTKKHFSSGKLYLHGFITGLLAWLMIGWQYWPVALIILLTHTLIDGWKSFQKPTVGYFLFDQALHLLVIILCWYACFVTPHDLEYTWQTLNNNPHAWKILAAFVFVTTPSGILIGKLTGRWRDEIKDAESLANAGKWIGITERIIILVFVLQNQYSAIGLLVAAKGIIRFNEKDRQEIKTEYLVVGTLMSIAIAVAAGMLARQA